MVQQSRMCCRHCIGIKAPPLSGGGIFSSPRDALKFDVRCQAIQMNPLSEDDMWCVLCNTACYRMPCGSRRRLVQLIFLRYLARIAIVLSVGRIDSFDEKL